MRSQQVPESKPILFKIKSKESPLVYAERIAHKMLNEGATEVELTAVGHAITNLLQTSSMLAEYVEFLHRLNMFAFKPCHFCTDLTHNFENFKHSEKLLTQDEVSAICASKPGEDIKVEKTIEAECSRSYGNHFMITFCQRMSTKDIYDHKDPGYIAPMDIPNKRVTLQQING
jgi:hypothetical protein